MSQPPPPDAGPRSPAKLGAPQWRAALVMSFKEFRKIDPEADGGL